MLREYLKSIADKIRETLGITDKINAQNFPDYIGDAYSVGHLKGYDAGYETLENHLRNCDNFQYFFANDKNKSMLEIWKEDYTSNCENMSRMFSVTKSLITAPRMNTSKCINFTFMYYQCSNLKTIPLINVSNGYDALTDMFRGDTNLEEIHFEGTIPSTIDFTRTKISVGSMKDVITHLVNYTGDVDEYFFDVLFDDDAWDRLEVSGKPYDEGLTDDKTLSWQDYVTDVLKWNT